MSNIETIIRRAAILGLTIRSSALTDPETVEVELDRYEERGEIGGSLVVRDGLVSSSADDTTEGTIAEMIARRFVHGGTFTDEGGHDLIELCERIAVIRRLEDGTRYELEDGSVIVVQHGACWDVGYPDCDCVCGQDAGAHDEECIHWEA